MGTGRIRGLGRASSRSARDRVAIGSFSLLAVCLVCFALVSAGVFQRAFVIEVDEAIAPLFGFDDADGLAAAQGGSSSSAHAEEASASEGESDAAASSSVSVSLFSQFSLPGKQEIADKKESAVQESATGGQTGGGASVAGSGGGGAASGSGSGPSGGGSADSGQSQPGLSESQEQAYLQSLRSNYDLLGGYYQRVVAGWQELFQIAPTVTKAQRDQYFSAADSLFYETSVTHSAISDLQVPENSRYHASYLEILQLNHDVDSAAALLRQSWGRCCDPNYPDDWMTPFNANSVNGQITFLADFEARYPGARP